MFVLHVCKRFAWLVLCSVLIELSNVPREHGIKGVDLFVRVGTCTCTHTRSWSFQVLLITIKREEISNDFLTYYFASSAQKHLHTSYVEFYTFFLRYRVRLRFRRNAVAKAKRDPVPGLHTRQKICTDRKKKNHVSCYVPMYWQNADLCVTLFKSCATMCCGKNSVWIIFAPYVWSLRSRFVRRAHEHVTIVRCVFPHRTSHEKQ